MPCGPPQGIAVPAGNGPAGSIWTHHPYRATETAIDAGRYVAVRRRTWLVGATGAAGGILGGCAGLRGGSGPAAQTPVIELSFAPYWVNQAPWNPTAVRLVEQFIAGHFRPSHRANIRVKAAGHTGGQAANQITAAIAGTGFVDVFNDCCVDLPTWMDSGLLLPLEALLRRDNVPTSRWSAGRIGGLTLRGHLLGLPVYDGPEVMVYRQDLLDSFGLQYPDPAWNYLQAEALWRSCARQQGSQRVYGASLDNFYVNADYLMHGFGGSTFNAGHTRCTLDQPACIHAGDWLFGLIDAGVISPTRDSVTGLVTGRDVFSVCGGWNIFAEATQLGSKFKWNILPQPRWAVRRAVMVNSDFYAIDARTRNTEAAWQLLRWVAAEPDFTRFSMRTTLIQPALTSLWSEWEAIAQQAAPTLKGKDLQYYREAAVGGFEVPQSFFLYDGAQAASVLGGWWGKVQARQVGVQTAFKQAASQINALERVGQSNPPPSIQQQIRLFHREQAGLRAMFRA